ncbi:MAG: hypothetical protein RIR16_617 [Actinomycetota bacterium]|jgi:hypothetical protein
MKSVVFGNLSAALALLPLISKVKLSVAARKILKLLDNLTFRFDSEVDRKTKRPQLLSATVGCDFQKTRAFRLLGNTSYGCGTVADFHRTFPEEFLAFRLL